MKVIIVFVGVLFCSLIVACGSSNSNCSFVPSNVTNGPNSTNATSLWNCTSTDTPPTHNISFYSDGTGYDSKIGTFNWYEASCQVFTLNDGTNITTLQNLSGSVSSNSLVFTKISPTQVTTTSTCTIQNL